MIASRCVLFFMGLIFCHAVEDDYDPMVAFQCDRPSMYLTSSGWAKDETTGCLKDPSSILAFCQKSFPNLDIRNVVESTHQVTITKWCNFGEKDCKHKFTTTPYRCLAGPFQSDALLVPEGCVFDHIHDSNFCTTLSEWSKTSAKNCQGRGMVQNSFSVLQPCGVNRFQGVEFVCCPPTSKNHPSPSPPTPPEKTAPLKSKEIPAQSKKVGSPKEEKDHLSSIETEGPLTDYLKGDNFLRSKKNGKAWNEHEFYKKAKEDMEKKHHEKIAKMMKDWGVARQRVQELKTIDPKASDKLNKEVTSRFQKTYEAEELEAEMEKKQLIELHEQRIQAQLNEKKNLALDKYINAIEDEEAELMAIYRSLEHYIKILQKERYHAVNKLKRIKAYHPAEVNEARVKTIAHLGAVDKQVKKALDMLRQVPKFETKINAMIKKSIDALHSLDNIVYNHKDSRSHSTSPSTTTTTTSTTTTTTTKAADYFTYDTYSDDDDDDDVDEEYYDESDDDEEEDEEEESRSTPRPSKSKNKDEGRRLSRVKLQAASSLLVVNRTKEGTKKDGRPDPREYLEDEYYDKSVDENFKTAVTAGNSKSTTKIVPKIGKILGTPENGDSGDEDDDDDSVGDNLDDSDKKSTDDDDDDDEEEEDESKSVDGDDVDDDEEDEEEDSSEDESSDDSTDRKSHTTFNTAPTKMKTTSSFSARVEKVEPAMNAQVSGEPRKFVTKLQQKLLGQQQQDQNFGKTAKYGGAGGILEPQADHHQGSPAHIFQDHLHAKQSHIDKSKKDKEFSSAVPLGLTVGTVTVAIVIVAGVLVMRRRNHRRQHRMIPTEPMPIDLVTSPEESHVTNMQVNGYENPTYKYFEMNAQN